MVGISKIAPVRVISPLKIGSKDSAKKDTPTVTQKKGVKKQVSDDEQAVNRIDERI